jgi:hypothetical protein
MDSPYIQIWPDARQATPGRAIPVRDGVAAMHGHFSLK